MRPPVPPAPREPNEAARELVFAYTGRQKVMLIIGVVFALFGGPMSLVFAWGLPGDLALRVAARPVPATVVSAHTDESVEINGENPVVVAFAFEEGGVPHDGTSTFTGRSAAEFRPGAAVEAEVFPGRPDWARLKGGTYSTFGLIGLVVLLFPLVGVWLTFHAVRSNRREIRAFRHGVSGAGKVVHSAEETSTESNGKHPWVVKWEFEAGGQTYRGELTHMTHAMLSHFKVGDPVTVLYLFDSPEVNTLWVE